MSDNAKSGERATMLLVAFAFMALLALWLVVSASDDTKAHDDACSDPSITSESEYIKDCT